VTATLRVMTFNVRGFYHQYDGENAWQHREALNIATVRGQAPDLLGVQEAQTGNLKAYHRELPEYWWMAWPEYGNQPPYEWPAIYWSPERLQPLDSGGFWLSETPDVHSGSWETNNIRACAWVRFRDIASGLEFVHANTHLDHVSVEARHEGSRLIIARMSDAHPRAAIVMTGDFNDVPDSTTYEIWRDAGFRDAHREVGCDEAPGESYTNHAWMGYPFARADGDVPKRIDWILARDGARTRARVEACSIIRDAAPPLFPSDHFPVAAEVVIEGG
jgi:endonuclease/exonuclease/phosphatase family metal-dependent hydrolase